MPHYHSEKRQYQWSFLSSWPPFDIFPLSYIIFGSSHSNKKNLCLVNYKSFYVFFLTDFWNEENTWERHFLDEERKEIFAIKWLTAKVTILLDKRTSSLEISVYNNNVKYSFIYLTMLIKNAMYQTLQNGKWICTWCRFEFMHDADLIQVFYTQR